MVALLPITFRPRCQRRCRLKPASSRKMVRSLLSLIDCLTYSYRLSMVDDVLRPTGMISRFFMEILFLLSVRWMVQVSIELMLEKMLLLSIICCCICFNVISFWALTMFTTAFACCFERSFLLFGFVGKEYILLCFRKVSTIEVTVERDIPKQDATSVCVNN